MTFFSVVLSDFFLLSYGKFYISQAPILLPLRTSHVFLFHLPLNGIRGVQKLKNFV